MFWTLPVPWPPFARRLHPAVFQIKLRNLNFLLFTIFPAVCPDWPQLSFFFSAKEGGTEVCAEFV